MHYFKILSVCTFFVTAYAQTAEIEVIYSVSNPLNTFALKFLAQTARNVENTQNLALAPYTVWTLLAIISEGARGNTAKELDVALGLPPVIDKGKFRKNFKSLSKYLTQPTDDVQLDISNAIFAAKGHPLNQTFQQVSQSFYGVDVVPVDFQYTPAAVGYINNYIRNVTKNRITDFVTPDDLTDAQLFVTSALYFKGKWKLPFNKTATREEPFYDETGNKIGNVPMMYQSGPFPYSKVDYLDAHAVQLNYGKGDKMSMFVILPRKKQTLQQVLNLLTTAPIEKLIEILADAEQQFVDEDVEVYLPRFDTNSDLNLNVVLQQLEINEIFDPDVADLLGINPEYLYVSRVIQKAEIEVNEEGTVASAAAGGSFGYKSPPPTFRANKPFAYLIIDKQTRSIVFAGKVGNPKTR